jgi:hypothetical protein
MVISIVLFGGWELPNFLYLFLLNDFSLIN